MNIGSKILINAQHPEEVRVAIVEKIVDNTVESGNNSNSNNRLVQYDHDSLDNINKKGCIYKGIVSRLEPSLNAAFIEYDNNGRHGFLPASEVTTELYPKGLDHNQKHPIQALLQKGQEIIIQVEKEEQGNKGAALTTNLSLAGCYIVLMPMTADSGGISRQIEGEDREYLQRVLNQIDLPPSMSLIIRTASIGRSLEELLWDFNVLKSLWEAISQHALEHSGAHLLYKDSALLSRVIRDYLKPTVEEILIDDPHVYEEVLQLVQHVRPDFLSRVQYFDTTKGIPLFAHYQIEHEIESIFNAEIVLENGSTLIFDHREALTSIDINSARSTMSSDITTTAFKTNLYAATEIARQIRLRNIGGQIVIDFIHMSSSDQNRQSDQARQVEAALKQGLSGDKARIQIGKISKLGLLEISRQRLKTALDKSQLMTCQNCHGRGTHRQPQSMALSILRLLEQESIHYREGLAIIHVHATIANYLFNTYRKALCEMESHTGITIQLTSDLHKSAGDYEMHFYHQEHDLKYPDKIVRNHIPMATAQPHTSTTTAAKARPAPTYTALNFLANPKQGSWLSRLWRFFFGPKIKVAPALPMPASEAPSASSASHKHNPNHRRREPGSQPRHTRSTKNPRGETTSRPARPEPEERAERPERSTHTSHRIPRHNNNPNRSTAAPASQRPTETTVAASVSEDTESIHNIVPTKAPEAIKKRPAKKPPTPLASTAEPEILVKNSGIALQSEPTVSETSASPESMAPAVKKPSNRRRHYKRGPAKASSTTAPEAKPAE